MGDQVIGAIQAICLDDFYLGKSEVTDHQFHRFRPDHDGGDWSRYEAAQPAVRWQVASAVSAWLSAKAGLVFRLPGEAESEYAARRWRARPWGPRLAPTG